MEAVFYNPETGIIETTYTGPISPEELDLIIGRNLELIRETKSNLLFGDCRRIEHKESVTDIFEMVSRFEKIREARLMKEALLLPVSQQAIGDLEFYEMACRNRGLNVRLFADREEAIAWLLGKT